MVLKIFSFQSKILSNCTKGLHFSTFHYVQFLWLVISKSNIYSYWLCDIVICSKDFFVAKILQIVIYATLQFYYVHFHIHNFMTNFNLFMVRSMIKHSILIVSHPIYIKYLELLFEIHL